MISIRDSLAALAISFFFSVESPGEFPGLFVKTEISGFKSKAQCDQYREQVVDMLEYMGAADAKVKQCQRRDDA